MCHLVLEALSIGRVSATPSMMSLQVIFISNIGERSHKETVTEKGQEANTMNHLHTGFLKEAFQLVITSEIVMRVKGARMKLA